LAPKWLMRVIRLVIVLVAGGVVGLLAVPLFPQQAQDWVSSSQRWASGVAGQENETFPSRVDREFGISPTRTTVGAAQIPLDDSTPTPPVVSGSATTHDLRLFMLDLINQDRMAYGVAPVELGSNPAAQIHAEELFQNGFLGHWGLDGLKPYMRYTVAGGTGAEGENVSGPINPRVPGARYARTPVRDSLREAQQGLMTSPGHRRNILDHSHQSVNLGIACDDVDCVVVQQFESNYVQFERVPSIEDGLLAFSGRTLGGFVYQNAQVWFDPLPKSLQATQIGTTSCFDGGTPIAFIREPAPTGSYYTRQSTEYSWTNCRDPRDVDPVALPPKVMTALPDQTGRVPWEDARDYNVRGDMFEVGVDISGYLAQYGRGVYTIVIWGERDKEAVAVTNYSVFVQVP